MTRLHIDSDLPTPLIARPYDDDDRSALRHLWVSFRHQMSEFTRELPAPDGTYRSERLARALDPEDPVWSAWILSAGGHPIGFALTRAMDQPTRVVNSFFVVAPARRRGLGLHFARDVAMATPGAWTVAYQQGNRAAATFWPRVAASFGPHWRCEARDVPARPELPPDTWVSFTTR